MSPPSLMELLPYPDSSLASSLPRLALSPPSLGGPPFLFPFTESFRLRPELPTPVDPLTTELPAGLLLPLPPRLPDDNDFPIFPFRNAFLASAIMSILFFFSLGSGGNGFISPWGGKKC